MTLSIIIPCHNLEKYIQHCLDSLVIQENRLQIQREVIFVLDNCEDNTRAIIEQAMNNPKIEWNWQIIETSQGCPGLTRNVGMDAAKGEYLMFLDGDDWYTYNNTIDTLVGEMLKEEHDIIEYRIASRVNPMGMYGAGLITASIMSTKFIDGLRFNNKQNGEDNDFNWELWHVRKPKIKQLDFAPYFYNSPREGSQMWKLYHK